MLYKRLSKGLNQYTLVPADKFDDMFADMFNKNPTTAFYETIFDYDQTHVDQYSKTNSVAGLRGLTTNRLVFDFDSEQNLDAAKEDTKRLVSNLIMNGVDENAIRIYFSGSKGFHVEARFKERMNKSEVDNIVKNLTEGMETWDELLDEARLIRIPLTKHNKTGLYKVPLTRNELQEFPISKIKEIAHMDPEKDYDKFDNLAVYSASFEPCNLPAKLETIKNLSIKEKKELEENEVYQNSPDKSTFLQFLTPAKNALLQGYFDKGERNSACMILASTLRYLKFDKETAYNILKDTLRKRARRLGEDGYDKEELWSTIIEPIFAPSWKGGTFSEAENSLLKKTIERYELQSAVNDSLFKTPNDMVDAAFSFLKNFEANRVKTGIEILDQHVFLTKGMLVGLLGSPGSGKTSFLNSFVEHTSMANNNCLYVSMDMSEDLLAIRMLGKYTNKSMKELEGVILNNDNDPELIKAREVFTSNFNNVKFNFKTGPSLEDIDILIKHAKAACGENLTMVALDYLEKIRGPYTDSTANTAYIASRLSDMAKDNNVCIVLLLQPRKTAGDVREPLLNYRSIKGASSLEQDCRVILTIWRPGYDPEFASDEENNIDKYTSIAIVKQNMGGLGKFDFLFNPVTGTLKEMNNSERLVFDHDMDIIAQRLAAKKEKNNDDNGLF